MQHNQPLLPGERSRIEEGVSASLTLKFLQHSHLHLEHLFGVLSGLHL